MTKHLALLVTISNITMHWVGLGKENIDRLNFNKWIKTESVNFDEKVTIFYNYSDKNKISGEILEVTEEKIKNSCRFKQEWTNPEIKLSRYLVVLIEFW